MPLERQACRRGRKGIGGGELIFVESGDGIDLRQHLSSVRVLGLLQIRIDQVIHGVELIERPAAPVQTL